MDSTIKKLIARDGERETVDSSYEEMEAFITERIRPDFYDESILCIKFLVSYTGDSDEAEETSWFINPIYAEGSEFDVKIKDEDYNQDFFLRHGYSPSDSYGPKMASEFIPEILLLSDSVMPSQLFEAYSNVYNRLLRDDATDISDEEKYEMFIEELSTIL